MGFKRQWLGECFGAVPQLLGWPNASALGSAGTPALATTNRLTRSQRASRTNSNANGEMGWWWNAGVPCFRREGLIYEGMAAYASGATIAQKRLMLGLKTVDAAPGSVDPSSLATFIALAADTADANWQIMSRVGSGTVRKVDTGWAKALNEVLYTRIEGTASGWTISAKRWASDNLTATETSAFAEATYTTDVPGATDELGTILWGCNGAAAEATEFAGLYQSLVSPF